MFIPLRYPLFKWENCLCSIYNCIGELLFIIQENASSTGKYRTTIPMAQVEQSNEKKWEKNRIYNSKKKVKYVKENVTINVTLAEIFRKVIHSNQVYLSSLRFFLALRACFDRRRWFFFFGLRFNSPEMNSVDILFWFLFWPLIRINWNSLIGWVLFVHFNRKWNHRSPESMTRLRLLIISEKRHFQFVYISGGSFRCVWCSFHTKFKHFFYRTFWIGVFELLFS